jgi:hypothetical protein
MSLLLVSNQQIEKTESARDITDRFYDACRTGTIQKTRLMEDIHKIKSTFDNISLAWRPHLQAALKRLEFIYARSD